MFKDIFARAWTISFFPPRENLPIKLNSLVKILFILTIVFNLPDIVLVIKYSDHWFTPRPNSLNLFNFKFYIWAYISHYNFSNIYSVLLSSCELQFLVQNLRVTFSFFILCSFSIIIFKDINNIELERIKVIIISEYSDEEIFMMDRSCYWFHLCPWL